MTKVNVIADNIITSLGFTSKENIENIKLGVSGIHVCNDINLSPEIFSLSMVNTDILNEKFVRIANKDKANYTRFEKLIILSVSDVLKKCDIDVENKETLIIISTTKGNIDLLNEAESRKYGKDRIHLWAAAKEVQIFFNNPNTPIIISNACISGVLAINTGTQLIKSDLYKNVIVAGADIISQFVVSGFQSFKSLSPKMCKPFDKDRDGLTLGEGAGCIILSADDNKNKDVITIIGGGCNNDANHISGPSRTGEGLYLSIKSALSESGFSSEEIEFISAHGTATEYNDEMESIAISRHNMEKIPANSLKGYWGHTLGAAGIIESVATIHSLRENVLLPTFGYKNHGVSKNINIVHQLEKKVINNCLKIASGFGGCNAAIVFTKN
ncbi:MAG: hypothetical protein KAT68_13870 [Bacteroidales bacterium]|nr:hypothetical protein [Bacteroidales bacterium]